MANKESTAVNALIDLVQAKPLGMDMGDIGDDLFSTKAPAPRLPSGTSQIKIDDAPPKVRMITAPAARVETIPPLAGANPRMTLPPPTARASGTPAPSLMRPPVPQPPAPPVPQPLPPTATMKAASAPMPATAKPALPPPPNGRTTLPPPSRTTPQPPPRPMMSAQLPAVAAPVTLPDRPSKLDMTGDVITAEPWFEPSRAVAKFEEETFIGTSPVVRQERRRKVVVLKIVATSVVFVFLGVAVGAYIAFHGDDKAAKPTVAVPKPVATPTPTAQPIVVQPVETASAAATADTAPAPAPTAVAETPTPAPVAPTPAPTASLTDVRIDSQPSGATVMLVDNGKTTLLGSTPIATQLDPARGYDVVMTLEGHPTKMVHLAPSTSPHLMVSFTAAGNAAPRITATTPAPAPVHVAASTPSPVPSTPHHTSHVASSSPSHPVGQIADPFGDSGSSPSPTPSPKASAGGEGTLMVSAKPPCELVIDGKVTGMHTPQRAIPLSAGAHSVTFINAAEHINKTVSVTVAADKTTKLVKDLLN